MSYKTMRLVFTLIMTALILAKVTLHRNRPVAVQTIIPSSSLRISLPKKKVLLDIEDGKEVCARLFFTSKGVAFLWPDIEEVENKDCSATVVRNAGTWRGKLNKKVNFTQITGYLNIPSDAVPVFETEKP